MGHKSKKHLLIHGIYNALNLYKTIESTEGVIMITKENNRDNSLDKNLQDDWIPDQQRKAGANSEQITEFGGDLKRKDTIGIKPTNPPSQKDPNNWKKKNV